MSDEKTVAAEHDAFVLGMLKPPDVQWVNGLPFSVSDEPPHVQEPSTPEVEPEPPAEFDGGTREPEPLQPDPIAEHNDLMLTISKAIQTGSWQ